MDKRWWSKTKDDDVNEKCKFLKYDDLIFKQNNFLVTTYGSTKKRLLIDGLHRADALTMAGQDQKIILEVNIVECLGDRIDLVFLLDIHQL